MLGLKVVLVLLLTKSQADIGFKCQPGPVSANNLLFPQLIIPNVFVGPAPAQQNGPINYQQPINIPLPPMSLPAYAAPCADDLQCMLEPMLLPFQAKDLKLEQLMMAVEGCASQWVEIVIFLNQKFLS